MKNGCGLLVVIFSVLFTIMEPEQAVGRDIISTCVVIHNLRTHQGRGAPKPINEELLDGEEKSRNSSSGKATDLFLELDYPFLHISALEDVYNNFGAI